MSHALSTGYWSTAIAKDQFVAKPDVRAFLKMARRNEPGLLRIFAPTLLVQGTADVTVLPGDTDDVARQLCIRGNDVEYRPIMDADHNGSMQKGGAGALVWIDARFKGVKAVTNCRALPKAGK
jgi:pimeloyl-ACP methyl ester carboxylesterase